MHKPFTVAVTCLAVFLTSAQEPPAAGKQVYGPDVQEMTAEQVAVFDKKVKEFPSKPVPLQGYVKPSIDGLRKLNPNSPGIAFSISVGRDVGKRSVIFVYGAYTPLKYGFSAKVTLKYRNGTTETKHFESTDNLRKGGTKKNIVFYFPITNLASVEFLILTRDGKNLLEASCVDSDG